LQADETGTLLARICGNRLARSLLAIAQNRAGGVPFFVEQLRAALLAGDRLPAGPAGLSRARARMCRCPPIDQPGPASPMIRTLALRRDVRTSRAAAPYARLSLNAYRSHGHLVTAYTRLRSRPLQRSRWAAAEVLPMRTPRAGMSALLPFDQRENAELTSVRSQCLASSCEPAAAGGPSYGAEAAARGDVVAPTRLREADDATDAARPTAPDALTAAPTRRTAREIGGT
jgi:hypothetical protein